MNSKVFVIVIELDDTQVDSFESFLHGLSISYIRIIEGVYFVKVHPDYCSSHIQGKIIQLFDKNCKSFVIMKSSIDAAWLADEDFANWFNDNL